MAGLIQFAERTLCEELTMPELPEVETIRRSLEPRLLGAKFQAVHVLSPKHWNSQGMSLPVDEHVQALTRHGKYLLIHLESVVLMVHFRMTGKLIFRDEPSPEIVLHTRWISYWTKANESLRLDFQDTRGFGGGELLPKSTYAEHPSLAKLGPDALNGNYDPLAIAQFAKRQRARSKIKGLLLDQTVLAGIGNIYADELLFRAGIRPDRMCGRISLRRLENLITLVKPLLQQAVGLGGTSFRDYVDSFGKAGVFALELDTYRRTGQPCHVCGTKIKRRVVVGRSTHYCPHCQT